MTRPGDETPPEADPHQGPFESLPSSVPDDDLVDTFRLPGEPARSTEAAPVHPDGPAAPSPEDHAAGQAGQDPAASAGASGPPHDGRPAGQGVSPGPTDDSDGAPAAGSGDRRTSGAGRRRDEELYAPGEEPREVDPDDAGWSLLGAQDDREDAQGETEEDPVAAERRRLRRRRRIRGIIVIGVLVLVIGSILSRVIGGLLPGDAADYPRTSGDTVTFTVNDGEGAILIGRRLEEAGIVASAEAFRQAAEMSPGKHIQPGEYDMQEQMTAEDAVESLQGAGRGAVAYVAVNRGERLQEVLDSLAAATPHDRAEFAEAVSDPQKYGLPEQATTVEGYLASGEYRLPLKDSAEDMVRALIDPTFAELEKMGVTDPDEQFRTVTIASIVEAEALPDDYPMVAGIIENRLKPDNRETDGLLQIDATVIYGLGERRLQFSSAERRDKSNEYNTYVHKGLPPGPIGAPSLKAIDAAAKPKENDYYYWVTVDISTGETKFAKTYAEHQKYQDEYRAYCRENPDIC
ncbi:protein YceG like [Micrococcus lylae]|uniref:Endolytic murein transglycosylase n=1 Tax=Micrococcus lylae TaxID=1273 RepID=A0A1R4IAN7_9MICC|nr:endolytic transglycosylase MltG [Micrococcus lylae]WIK82987.1 endolytic transglycosylase MltG [Micrococcus lylae]SJN16674.1 protein YceG like [Micrococcus lylae]